MWPEAVKKPFWFQVYVIRDRGFIRELIARAAAAKCSALVLTLDLQILGQRHCDIKNGMTVPPEIKLKNVIDIATKPAWALSILKGKRKTFGNLAGHVKGMENVNSLAAWTASQFDPTLNWKDVEWIKSLWPGKLILKGIMDLEDARMAAKSGADALIVSNHGGRQLDGAPSSISALPRIAEAVGNEIEVMVDGGIRSGQDVLRALALGARSCMIGRSYIYGLGAGGEAGVARAIEIIGKELDVSMALTGTKNVRDIDRRVLMNGDRNALDFWTAFDPLPLWPLVVDAWRRLGDIDRVGGREAVLQPLVERLFEAATPGCLAFLFGFLTAFFSNFVFSDAVVGNSHGSLL